MKPYAWMRRVRDAEDLPAPAKLVAIAIGLRASQDGSCYPSYEQIAKDTGLVRRTAVTHTQRLVRDGWLLAIPRCNGHGHQSNIYQLVDNRVGVVQEMHQVVQEMHPLGGARDAPRRRIPKEEVAEPSAEPVDNPALAAVLNLMGRQHLSPTATRS